MGYCSAVLEFNFKEVPCLLMGIATVMSSASQLEILSILWILSLVGHVL